MIKKVVSKVDKMFLSGTILKIYKNSIRIYKDTQRIYRDILDWSIIRNLESNLDHKFIVHYKKNDSSLLSSLCDKYGSDKGQGKKTDHPYLWPPHTYADFYSRLFDHCRLDVKRVFECGVGTNNATLPSTMGEKGLPGASLRVWRDYFPNAQIFGADIDKDILFAEDRIKTYYLDQTDPNTISKFWKEVGSGDFDIIVDDGLHTFEAGVCLFENSISRLSKRGIYIIEDVYLSGLLKYQHYFNNKQYQVDYVNLVRPRLSFVDNNLVIIRKASLDL